MKKYNKITVVMALLAIVPSALVQAKVRSVMTRRDFERVLAKESMVVALFYADEKKNRNVRNENKDLFRMYQDVSTNQLYDDADVVFLKINAGRKDLADLAQSYGVTDTPACIFFNKAKRLVDDKGVAVTLGGTLMREDLQSVIDTHYGAEIKKRVDEKNKRRAIALKEANDPWKAYFYPRDIFVRDYDPSEAETNME